MSLHILAFQNIPSIFYFFPTKTYNFLEDKGSPPSLSGHVRYEYKFFVDCSPYFAFLDRNSLFIKITHIKRLKLLGGTIFISCKKYLFLAYKISLSFILGQVGIVEWTLDQRLHSSKSENRLKSSRPPPLQLPQPPITIFFLLYLFSTFWSK